ncbi:alpha- and gamma-adaptin-binding protein p34-like [Scylla paramamosain]|uniref:alpha- and gamma-adaptin-binding protein p34-like n=1 Tax=Scylla paramamosain TaxID=85552 RepID=UPI00308270B8
MTPTPCLVILSTPGKDGRDIVKGILDKECLPEPSTVVEGVECWEWWVENKYYTATVQLANISQPERCLPWIMEHGEACLIYCDATQNDVLERINNLVEKIGDFEPDVQLLVCDSLGDDDNTATLSALTGQQWCISNGWELVELQPHQPQPDPEEDDFRESWGFKRISQALHACTWSNLAMKDSQGNTLSAVLQSVSSQEDRNNSSPHETEEVMYTQLNDLHLGEEDAPDIPGQGLDNVLDPSVLQDCMSGEDGSFENLFSSFEHLKKTAASLPPTQRRDYAEKVAVAFWRAMGGDEDEVDGLDSD